MEQKAALTIKETAGEYNFPEYAIRTLVKRGAFPVVQVGNRCYIVRSIFEDYMKKGGEMYDPKTNPEAHPLFHSDRGFQYTNRAFHERIEKAGMRQSMSRVAKCIDNGPMEGFWGILKRERYYGKRFTDKAALVKMIEDYIDYYNNQRLQRNLGIVTPMEKHEIYSKAA